LAGLLGGVAALLKTDVLPAEVTEQIPKDVFTQLDKVLVELPQYVPAFKNLPPFADIWIPLLAGGGFFVLIALLLTRTIRNYRVKNTWVFGEPVSLKIGLPSAVFHWIANLILFLGTAGLVTPWLIAWNAQSLYQHAFVKARRREKAMDFRGSGFQVLGLCLLSLITLPLVPLTLGIWAVYLDARWIRWRQAHIVTPSPAGRGMMTMEFQGTWGSLLVRTLMNLLLVALSAGLLQPWATAARWRWVARWTFAGEEEKARGRGRSSRTGRRDKTGRRDRSTSRRRR
jgi:uncharacterized membrane protein YjgN (DUF898 family)